MAPHADSAPDGESFDELDSLTLDEEFISGGVREDTAEDRIAKAQRIARANDRLRAQGEISDGTGKPAYRRLRRSIPWIVIGAAIAGGIVLVAILAR